MSEASPSVLVLLAHPDLERSRINRAMAAGLEGLPGVTVRDLQALYPDGAIDSAAEQAALEAHDVIVMQFPFHWYSTPPVLKAWQDQVLTRGWAYGSGGTALHGKRLVLAVSTGGPAEAYQRDGYNHFTIEELLAPLRATARLCGLMLLPPFLFQGVFQRSEAELAEHVYSYRSLLTELA
jgi:glutathione-regulated potassium-efflux system ancillary protein KefG